MVSTSNFFVWKASLLSNWQYSPKQEILSLESPFCGLIYTPFTHFILFYFIWRKTSVVFHFHVPKTLTSSGTMSGGWCGEEENKMLGEEDKCHSTNLLTAL